MKKLIIFYLLFSTGLKSQTCTALYSYGANFETVHFFNQSTTTNIHYYWNFGDGTGSNLKNPIHEFLSNGSYLVTLYIHDTISDCSAFYDQWLTITKFTLDPCSPFIDDSIFNVGNKHYLKIIDISTTCGNYSPMYKVGYSSNGPLNNSFGIGYYNGNFLSCGYYYSNNNLKQAAMKTSPYYFDRSKNYQNCSANFEFTAVSEDANGQRILFKAMNKSALRYEWLITGFGDPIYSNDDTISIYYPGFPNSQFPNLANDVILSVREQNGCRDSTWQEIIVRTKNSTYVGLQQLLIENLKVEIVPNPVQDKMTLQFDQNKIDLDKLSVVNTLGQTVFVLNKPQEKEEIDLRFLSTGIYYLKVENKEGQKVFKVIKE